MLIETKRFLRINRFNTWQNFKMIQKIKFPTVHVRIKSIKSLFFERNTNKNHSNYEIVQNFLDNNFLTIRFLQAETYL